MTEYPLEILIMIIWLTHLYEYGLPHAGLGSLPYMSLLVVEHFATTSMRSDEESGHLVSERSR